MILRHLFGAALLAGSLGASAAQARVIERIVAVVNDEIVTYSELEDMARPLLAQVDQISDPVDREQTRERQLRRVLDELVGQRLIMQEAARRRITIDSTAVDEHLDRIKGRQGWDDDKLRVYLSGQGMSLTQFRSQVREQLLKQRIIRRILGKRIQVSERELKDYFREKLTQSKSNFEVEAAHIVLRAPDNATAAEEAALRQQATEIIARAKSGEDFAALAAQYSEGPRAKEGGALGFIRRGNLDPTLEEAFFALEPGGVAGPVRTNFGYHVVTVKSRKAVAPPTYDEAVPALTAELREKKLATELTKWVADMKKKAFIETRL
ncbi:MAG: peptidyl-prolyl cis-trans isomerase SurA [Bradymonadia bacterium]|jgi:peptidyl-prolyl cis-trans isomerase SurA